MEARVIHLAARGLTNPEIAAKLSVGRETVKSHVSAAFRKLGVYSRTQAAERLRGIRLDELH